MGPLTNAHCLLDLVEKAPVSVLKVFSGLAESQALARGFDWSQDEDGLRPGLLEHIKHLKSAQRDPAEREALRVLRLASRRGAAILLLFGRPGAELRCHPKVCFQPEAAIWVTVVAVR